MNTHRRASRLLPLLVILTLMSPVAAQQGRPQKSSKNLTDQDLATAKPGRDPNQPIDEEYTKKIKEYTTAPYFLSPLVDYLPAAKGIPTPKARVYTIGTSEEGREMIAIAIASEALMAKLDANKADLAKLADPRTIQ